MFGIRLKKETTGPGPLEKLLKIFFGMYILIKKITLLTIFFTLLNECSEWFY